MFSIYNNDLPSSTTLVLKGEKKHVSKLLLMDTDTAKTAMTDWRAQALSLKTKRDNSSFSVRRLVVWLRRAIPAAPLVLGGAGLAVVLQLPLKVLASHLVEHHVKGFVELVQPPDHVRVYFRVSSPFRLAEASGSAAVLRFLQTGESFSFIEVKVFIRHDPLQPQEVLHFCHLTCGIHDEPLPAHKVHLGEREILHPALQVECVYPDTQSTP